MIPPVLADAHRFALAKAGKQGDFIPIPLG